MIGQFAESLIYVGWALFLYFIAANIVYYLFVHALSLVVLGSKLREVDWYPVDRLDGSPFLPGIAIVSPVYNEYDIILDTVQSYLDTDYPDKEIILVNDGSTDGTFEKLTEAYALKPMDVELPSDVPSEPIRGIYRSAVIDDLYVIDKENGGIGDAQNPGIWFTEKPLFCVVDSDSYLTRDALRRFVGPFLEQPERTVGVGASIHVANACEIRKGQVTNVQATRNPFVGIAIVEYLRAFYSNRLGMNLLRSLHNISGACGMFRTDVVREVGGYHRDTKAEDMEMVLRLHRYLRGADRDYRLDHVINPVCWTDVPDTARSVGRQRRRWYQGTLEVLIMYRRMIGNPRYGIVGLFALPAFGLAEVAGRPVEALAYLLIPFVLLLEVLTLGTLVLVLVLVFGFATFFGWLGVASDAASFTHYRNPLDVTLLLLYGACEHLGYRQWRVFVSVQGLFDVINDDIAWRKM
jgi:cellulose synthase/poly-beta-1,6-N-acetylglucosamine synthase-like glycosyltransferase